MAKPQGGEAPEEEEEIVVSTGEPLVPALTERPSFIDLIKYSAKEDSLKTIRDKRAEYDKITIDGVDDKDNYKKVVANMSQMRDDRRAFENAAYDNVIDPLKEALKVYAADIDAVVAEFKAGEKAERDKKDFIDEEKKRVKKEAEEAKQRAALQRANDLNLLGAAFNGTSYSFDYDDTLSISIADLKDYEDKDWNIFIAQAKSAYDKEQERINDQLAADELAAEQARVQAIKDKALVDAANEKVRKVREKELIRVLGYSFSEVDGEYSHPDIPITVRPEILSESDDESWEALIFAIEHYEAVVTPEPAPVDEEPEQLPATGFTGPGSAGSRFEVRHFSEFENLQEDEEQTALVENEDIEFAEVIMQFNVDHPFTDVDISPKMFQRFYPEEYADKATAGIEVIANSGKVQDLCWMILAKGS